MADGLDVQPFGNPSTCFHQACAWAGTDFAVAASWLGSQIPSEASSQVLEFVAERLAVSDPGAVACIIYLLAEAGRPDRAASAGWYALEHGCDEDQVIVALADILPLQARPRQSSVALLEQRASDSRSTAFLIKLADHFRTAGQAFLAEDMLCAVIRRGRRDLLLRLAEHWVEHRNWSSARDLLAESTEPPTAYARYLATRCSVALLLGQEVMRGIDALHAMPAPGPTYAALLRSLWTWRTGDPAAAWSGCPSGTFPPLIARDADALHRARTKAKQGSLTAPAVANRGIAPEDLPNVLGIGMQRTGTTWLWQRLRHHPDVQTGMFKELVFFDDHFGSAENIDMRLSGSNLAEAGDRYWAGPTRSLAHYRRLFAEWKPVRLDYSPSYAELPGAAVSRVRDVLGPDVKIILSVRDPVERCWSNLKYDLHYTGAHPLGFSFRERAAFYRTAATMRRCDYLSVLKTWRAFFGDVAIVFTEDIFSRPNEVIADLYRFVGCASPMADECGVAVNDTDQLDMPHEDRLFLFGLHQHVYDAAEAELGGTAMNWRQRQLDLLDVGSSSEAAIAARFRHQRRPHALIPLLQP